MSCTIADRSLYYIGQQITFQDWQYIAIAISRKHVYKRGTLRGDFENKNNKDNNKELYKALDNLTAYYTKKAAANYSIIINILKNLSIKLFKIFGQVSC